MPNIALTVYLYDVRNKPLKQKGIRLDLHNAVTNLHLASAFSDDLNPPSSGHGSSNEWGGRFTYFSVSDPVDILITDAKFEYPGNIVRYVNGDRGGRVDLDLRKLPVGVGGQAFTPTAASPEAISKWVDSAYQWSRDEKKAVKELIFNFARIVVANRNDPAAQSSLSLVADNWAKAIDRLGFPSSILWD
jgi:hypothetical protein